MIKFICIEILIIVLVSLICFYINIKDKKIKKCKLEKLSFVNNLKENRNELIFIKENNNNEDYLYHNCIDTANNIKRNILLADIYIIGDTILIMLPDLIYYCSHILKLINSIWDEDNVYTERINSILEELKF